MFWLSTNPVKLTKYQPLGREGPIQGQRPELEWLYLEEGRDPGEGEGEGEIPPPGMERGIETGHHCETTSAQRAGETYEDKNNDFMCMDEKYLGNRFKTLPSLNFRIPQIDFHFQSNKKQY